MKKKILFWLILPLISFFILIGAFLISINNKAQDFKLVKLYMVHYLNKIDPHVSFIIEKSSVMMKDSVINLSFENISLSDKDRLYLGNVKKVFASFDLKDLKKLHFFPKKIAIYGPNIDISTIMSYEEELDKINKNEDQWFGSYILGLISETECKLVIYDGNIEVNHNAVKDLNIKKLSSNFTKKGNEIKIDFSSDATIDNKKILFDGRLYSIDSQKFQSELKISNLPEKILLKFLPKKVRKLINSKEISLLLNGSLNIDGDFEGNMNKIIGHVDSNDGKIANRMIVNKLDSDFIIENNGNIIKIHKVFLDFDEDTKLNIQGFVDQRLLNRSLINLELTNFNVAELINFWPKKTLSDAKTWIKENVKSGFVSHISGKIGKGSEADENQQSLDLDIKGDFKNLTVSYDKDFPIISAVEGQIKFDSKNLKISAETGLIGDSDIKKIEVTIPYAQTKNSYIVIEGKVEGPSNDLLAYLPNDFELTSKMVLGTAKTQAKIAVPLFIDDVFFKDILFDVTSDVNIDKFLFKDKILLQSSLAKMKFNGKYFTLNSKILAEKIPVDIDLKVDIPDDLERNNNLKYSLAYNFSLEGADAKRLTKKSLLKYYDGKLKIEGKFYPEGEVMGFSGEMDLKDLSFAIPLLNYSNKIKEKNILKFSGQIKDDSILFKQIQTEESSSLNMKASAILGKEFILNNLQIKNFITENNDFSYEYSKKENKENVNIKAKKLSISNDQMKKILFSPDNNNKIDNAEVEIDADHLELANNEVFNKLTLKYHIIKNDIKNMKLALIDKQNFVTSLALVKKEKEKSILMINSENAGQLLKALDVSDKINSGILSVESEIIPGGQHKGELTISNFAVKNDSVLTKIIGTASLTGLANLVRADNNLHFSKFVSDYQIIDNIIYLYNGQINGNTLNLTFYGTIDLNTNMIELKGLVMPDILGLNFLGKIPVIGNILSGGKQGILGANYSLKGKIGKASVSVNPLSLTPNILRNFFDRGNQCQKLGLKSCSS